MATCWADRRWIVYDVIAVGDSSDNIDEGILVVICIGHVELFGGYCMYDGWLVKDNIGIGYGV